MKASPLHRFCESADAAELKLYILNDVPSFQKVLLKERFLLGFLVSKEKFMKSAKLKVNH